MRLKSIKLSHFRGYRETVVIPVEEGMTGIVGRNDYGKSTILEALALFFEIDGTKSDKTDMNCFSLSDGLEQFEIACEFDDLPSQLVLDENVETTLGDEYLINASGHLEIAKLYRASTGKLEKTSIRCQHPADQVLGALLSLKMADLKKLGEERGVAEAVADKRVSSLWRKAIRASAGAIVLQETLLDVDKGLSTDSKSIWGKIQDQLPTFALFKSDRESSDGDVEAKNPLQQAVKDAQAALQDRITKLEQEIEKSVLDVAGRTLDKLREMAPDLANELVPRFKEKPKWTFSFTLDGENGIPINKRGSGVRRLILLNFFRAEAERAVTGTQRNVIYAIEEPETSQHPNYQIMLMKALLALSQQDNRQIIVTTHVPALAGLMPIESIRYVTKNAAGVPTVKLPDEPVLKEATESLGVLPETGMERAKGVVLVEGKSDVTFLKHAASILKEAGHIAADLEDAGVVPILIGGCGSVKHWVTLNLADNLGLPWCVFLDSDVGGDPVQVKSIQKRQKEVEAQGRRFYSTRKREIENYLCPDLILALTGKQVAFTDTCDAKKIIGKAASVKPDDVIDTFWPKMTAEKIISRSHYQVNGQQKSEIKEVIEELLQLV
ncbi:OLD family endonuclease [Sinorhizobium medicae]|uniref:OLD family endonuclease n=1 Tax=Sinorhizobium medicae TaxID=110321 RepID=A0ABX4TCM2_9HYPH|nr:AAA family ATPase [Sinorhizobium medicae]MDX0451343.1 AAA family ATPase [Sinorhizobium medicae]MDX0537878.1 AAA family ATPase [Sinorhizobium medicae]MDX1047678.1 AAA family ATPase [Sinorhizobium medicae]MDX1060045.1 AAA family ATPase [Sinorhizobium medicae]MDX1134473.1 AAA family ATPase [Sinorhizobium medicae]